MAKTKRRTCIIYIILSLILFVSVLQLFMINVVLETLNPQKTQNNIIPSFNLSLFDDNLQLHGTSYRHYNVFIIGIVSFHGYNAAKAIYMNLSNVNMIGIDSFDVENGVHTQREREQELIRSSITVIRGNVCDYRLLSHLLDDNTHIKIVVIAYHTTTECHHIYHELIRTYDSLLFCNASTERERAREGEVERKTTKQYLLMTTLYVFMGDPMHGKKTVEKLRSDMSLKYNDDWYWGLKFMRPWYKTFENVTRLETLHQTDIVVIHDGIRTEIFQRYPRVIFINYGQYPKKTHQIRASSNDIRYYHFAQYLAQSNVKQYRVVLITDLRDVRFGRDPFDFLSINNKEIYVGSELEHKEDETMYWRWQNHVMETIKLCFDDDYIKETKDWIFGVNGINLNPGIIASNYNIVMQLLDTMKRIFNDTRRARANCNFVVYQVAIYQLCIMQNQCIIQNDKVFHSPFGLNKDPLTTDYVIYHK